MLATSFGTTFHGVDGLLYLLALICFVVAAIVVVSRPVIYQALLTAGLALWVLTNLVHGG